MYYSEWYSKIEDYFENRMPGPEIAEFKDRIENDEEFCEAFDVVSSEKYVAGELKGSQLEECEKRIKSDPLFHRRIKLLESVDSVLGERFMSEAVMPEKEKEDRRLIAGVHKEYMNREKPKKKKIYLRIPAAAASIIILVFSSILIYQNYNSSISGDELFDKYYQPYKVSSYRSTERSKLISAIEKYKQERYFEAYNEFSELDNVSNEVILMQGISLVESGKESEAILKFNNIIESDDITLREHALWYTGLCFMKIEDLGGARKHFKELAGNDASVYQKRSGKILRQID